MAERKATRLSKAAREFNVGISTIVEFLGKKGHEIDSNPNSKLDPELYDLLEEEYSTDLNVKKESEKLTLKNLRERQESLSLDDVPAAADQEETEELIITDHTAGMADKAPSLAEEEAPVAKEEPKPKIEEPVAEAGTKASEEKQAAKTKQSEKPSEEKPDMNEIK